MASSQQDIETMLQSLAQDASNDIARAIENVANAFVATGGYGSSHMHIASNEKIMEIFRSTGNAMAKQASLCAGGGGGVVRELVDAHLSQLIDQTIKSRTEHMETGKRAFQDTEILCGNLRRDLKRLKDATVRGLRG